MKKIISLLSLSFLAVTVFAQQYAQNLIPQPVSVIEKKGELVLRERTRIYYNDKRIEPIAKEVQSKLFKNGIDTISRLSKTREKLSVYFAIVNDSTIKKDGYILDIDPKGITLYANEPSGIFYGSKTLLQLAEKHVEYSNITRWGKGVDAWFNCVQIKDHPRFQWRGLMLDVSRHFFTKEEVKRFIDDMVKYKFNTLHWHLTDDQGWRIEIKSYPKLTSVGAWNVKKVGRFGTFSDPAADEPRNYGGFYTQEDIKEIVQYAAQRFVTIVPEIDVPGHSLAALAAYPELSCTPGNYKVNSGEKFMIWPGGGQHFYGILDNTLCPANEKVYTFLDKVFGEVAALFPSEYIHMGGDETAHNFWEKSEQIKQLMQEKGLKNLDEVQSYFVKRVERIIESKGKKMIGWDEILQGGLPPNAAVMSWQGMKGGIEAAKQGRKVVMTPTDFVYLDYMQGDPIIEAPVYASLRLKKTYQFDPVPDGVDANLILGGQGNLWTEQIYNLRQVQYMIWPRAFAVAEILWSPKGKKDFNGFAARVEKHFERLDAAETKYSPAIYDPEFKVAKKDSAGVVVTLIPEIEGLSFHYSFDNSLPDNYYPAYKEPLLVPKDAQSFRVISYRNGKPVGRMIIMPVEELKKRAGVK